MAEEMPTGLDPSVLVPLCADLTQLEGAAYVAVELVLLLGHSGGWTRETTQKTISQQFGDVIYVLSW